MARRRSGSDGGGCETRAKHNNRMMAGYLAWIVAAVGAVAACDFAVDSCAVESPEAASGPDEWPAA